MAIVYFREIVQRDESHAYGFLLLTHKSVHQVLTWKSWSISVTMDSFAVFSVSKAIVQSSDLYTVLYLHVLIAGFLSKKFIGCGNFWNSKRLGGVWGLSLITALQYVHALRLNLMGFGSLAD